MLAHCKMEGINRRPILASVSSGTGQKPISPRPVQYHHSNIGQFPPSLPISTIFANFHHICQLPSLLQSPTCATIATILACMVREKFGVGREAKIPRPEDIGTNRQAALSCALHCTTLYCTALSYTKLHCTELHYTTLHCTTLHCTVLSYTGLEH